MKKTKILVTAANGHTGFPAAKELLNLGFDVRAMVRNPKGKGATELKKMGAQIFKSDMNDIRDLREALKGVQRAYFCSPFGGRNTLFQLVAFVAAAEASHLEHVVYMSGWLSMEDHYAMETKEQWLSDQVIKMHKNVKFTILNPGLFGFTYFFTVEPIAQLGMLPTPVKGAASSDVGLNAPPSEEDIGRVIAHILKDPAKHAGKTYRPTGPELISVRKTAEIFGKILGRKVKINEVSESMLLKSLKAAGFPMYELSNVHYFLKELEKDTFAVGGGVTSVVKDITGRDPEDFETIARRILADMPESKQSFGNKIKAIKNLMKIMFTKEPDMAAYERQQYFPQLMHGLKYAKENTEWVKIHENQLNN